MLILGIDTATLTLSMALVERSRSGAHADRLLAAATEPPPAVQSKILPTRLLELLAEAKATVNDLDAIVIGRGPGSFTGLRISLATAKGICYARRIPLVGISSLAAMALSAADADPEGTLFVPTFDARKGDVYCGLYRREGATVRLDGEELAIKPELLAERLASEKNARCFGIGREAYPVLASMTIPGAEARTPDARALVRLAPEIPAYDAQAVFALEPHYVRPPEVEWALKPKKERG